CIEYGGNCEDGVWRPAALTFTMMPGGSVSFTYDQLAAYASGNATTTDGANFTGTLNSAYGFPLGALINWSVSGTSVTGSLTNMGPQYCAGQPNAFVLVKQ